MRSGEWEGHKWNLKRPIKRGRRASDGHRDWKRDELCYFVYLMGRAVWWSAVCRIGGYWRRYPETKRGDWKYISNGSVYGFTDLRRFKRDLLVLTASLGYYLIDFLLSSLFLNLKLTYSTYFQAHPLMRRQQELSPCNRPATPLTPQPQPSTCFTNTAIIRSQTANDN